MINRILILAATFSAILLPAAAQTIVIQMAGQEDTSSVDANSEITGTLCTGEDWVVFSGVSTRNGKITSICMMEGDDTAPGHLTYRYGRPGEVEMVYPPEAVGSFDVFTIRRYTRPQTTYLKFEFYTGGYQYAILDGAEAGEEELPQLRVTRLSDSKVLLLHDLVPTTEPLSLMELDSIVRSAPFDE